MKKRLLLVIEYKEQFVPKFQTVLTPQHHHYFRLFFARESSAPTLPLSLASRPTENDQSPHNS